MPGMWIKGLPPAPGRYWWRAEPRNNRSLPEYGIALVAWVDHRSYDSRFKPELRVRSVASFSTSFQCDTDQGHGWSSGTQVPPGTEFWSEQLTAPPGLVLPNVPGLAPPPSSEELAAEAARRAEAALSAAKLAEESRSATLEAIRAAEADKATLLLCSSCDSTFSESESVVLRECPHCEEGPFDATEGSHCPTCNRPFTRNTGCRGCPHCAADMDDATTLVHEGVVTDEGAETVAEES